MAISLNTGIATIEGDVNAVVGFPFPATGQVIKNSGRVTGTGALGTVFTATAGKTAYVFAIIHYGSVTNSCNWIKNDGTTIMATTGVTAVNDTFMACSPIPLFEVAGGESLKFNAPANQYVTAFYYEV